MGFASPPRGGFAFVVDVFYRLYALWKDEKYLEVRTDHKGGHSSACRIYLPAFAHYLREPGGYFPRILGYTYPPGAHLLRAGTYPRPFLLPLFTGVRGRGVLRSSALSGSRKFVVVLRTLGCIDTIVA